MNLTGIITEPLHHAWEHASHLGHHVADLTRHVLHPGALLGKDYMTEAFDQAGDEMAKEQREKRPAGPSWFVDFTIDS